MVNARSPLTVLQTEGCSARVLSLSDLHATVLVSAPQGSDESDIENSLLKLTVVPSHREILSPEGYDNPDEVSKIIVGFLNRYFFQLTSESGAEYSYYDATPKQSSLEKFAGKIRSLFVGWVSPSNGSVSPEFKVELVSPASERQVQRATPPRKHVLIEETAEIYESVTKPYIQAVLDTGSLSWVQNVVDGTKESERLLLDQDDYILNVDTKWRSHPTASSTPRQEWFLHKSVSELYCLAISKDGAIRSLRDLRRDHLPMLQSMATDAPLMIQEIYGVARDQLRIFVHYHPQFYHFHVHFTRLGNEIGCQVERGHLLSDIIQNLEMDDLFYAKRTIAYKLPTHDKLYQHLTSYSSGCTTYWLW